MSCLRIQQLRNFTMLLSTLFSVFLMIPAAAEEADPAEIAIGERLFMETRFAQYFATRGMGGDPTVEVTATIDEPLPGPFAGESINCSSCHLVDQQLEAEGGGMRTYADFARRSPIPAREDGKTHAVRNSQALVNTSIARPLGVMFHFDGEFDSLQNLVEGTLTGRNYGWLPGERSQAIAHIASVIRQDDGTGALAQEFGGAYATVFRATANELPPELVLPEPFRLDIDRASDEAVFQHVARLIAVYVEDLAFLRDDADQYSGSPYDRFLQLNHLPAEPRSGETPARYSQRLMLQVSRLTQPVFVNSVDSEFVFHDQDFVFGPEELRGMRLFFSRPSFFEPDRKAGNCVACHPAPDFSDFALHNTGITQVEYDQVHGQGSFMQLDIPTLDERRSQPLQWLPATENRPTAAEPMRAIPRADNPQLTDLGSWNIFANDDYPISQDQLGFLLCREQIWALLQRPRYRGNGAPCATSSLLERSVATFKTPSLRDLGHSAPYMHNGQLDTLEDVVSFYIKVSAMARQGELRNSAPGLQGVNFDANDVTALAAFLRALNEDYE